MPRRKITNLRIVGKYYDADNQEHWFKYRNVNDMYRFLDFINSNFPRWAFFNVYAPDWIRVNGRSKAVNGPLIASYTKKGDRPPRHFYR